VKYEFRSGTQDQDYIQGFPGVENELQVSYELKQAVPYVRAVSNTNSLRCVFALDGRLFYSRKTMAIKSVPALNTLSIFQ
jgi:predicted phage tail protein